MMAQKGASMSSDTLSGVVHFHQTTLANSQVRSEVGERLKACIRTIVVMVVLKGMVSNWPIDLVTRGTYNMPRAKTIISATFCPPERFEAWMGCKGRARRSTSVTMLKTALAYQSAFWSMHVPELEASQKYETGLHWAMVATVMATMKAARKPSSARHEVRNQLLKKDRR
jgi:hypothetical protein